MKNVYMRQIYMGMVGDMKNLEQHYADMAEKGWMIDKIGFFTHRYRAIEPCKMRFFVDLLPQITAFDYPENEDAQEYRRICEDSGWAFVAANKQLHVFCADGENPALVPIHTDNAIHAKNYLKACRQYDLPGFICGLLWLCLPSSPLYKGVELFLSNTLIFISIGLLPFSVGCFWQFGFVISWYLRTRKAAKHNLPMPRVNRRIARLRGTVFMVGAVAFFVSIATGVILEISGGAPPVIGLILVIPFSAFGVGFWIRHQINTKERTRAANIGLSVAAIIAMEIILIGGMTFVIMNTSYTPDTDELENLPVLTLNDVGITSPPEYSTTRVEGTPLVPVDYRYGESNGEGRVETHVYRSVHTVLTQWLYDHFAAEFAYELRAALRHASENMVTLSADEAAIWGAEKGVMFRFADSNAVVLLLRNGNTIMRLTADGPTADDVSRTVRDLFRRIL